MWVKVSSIAALVVTLTGGAMYYMNYEALLQEKAVSFVDRNDPENRFKNAPKTLYEKLTDLRDEFTREKNTYVDFLGKNEGLRKDIAALTARKEELIASNDELTQSNANKEAELEKQKKILDELMSKVDIKNIEALAIRVKELEDEATELESTKQAEQVKYDGLVSDTEQLMANNAALRQLKSDQDSKLSPPNLKTKVNRVIDEFNLVVIDGGAVDHGIVPGSRLAVMRDGNKIAELDVNAVEDRVSTAVIIPTSVQPGEVVEPGDTIVSIRPDVR